MSWIAGFHAVSAAVAAGEVTEVRLASDRRDRRSRELEALCRKTAVKLVRVPRRELDQLSRGPHQGVLAQGAKAPARVADEGDLEALLDGLAEPPLLLVLEGVTDPRNLGACLRSAEAAGAHAVLVPRNRTAPLSDVARKAASGAAERVPLVAVANLARTLRWLEQRGIWRLGLAGEADASLWQSSMTGGCALLLGAEGEGLRRLTREHCDQLIQIPMSGEVGSLNVSVAAGIALFEARRQRQDLRA